MGPEATATATAVVLPPGESLGGFRVMEVLGIGGMAIVYRAEQLSLHREVALKVLSAELGRDEVFPERFRREGMHVSRLDHPNIIPIYDAGADKGRLFLAMRLVAGMTLAERIRADPLSATETLDILGPVGDGLDCAHAAGLVHRDVKPQNILLTERGHPYLTDFGVAKNVDTVGITDVGGFVGSFHYAAPEQILGAPISHATDIYALTVVLYQCVTGTVPHAQYTDAGALFAHVKESPPRVQLAEAKAFNQVIERGMAKDPGDRYANAGELIDAAERALVALPSGYLLRRPTFPGTAARTSDALPRTEASVARARPRGPRPRRPRPRWIAAVAAGLVGVGLLLVGLLVSTGQPAAAFARVARSGGLAIRYRSPWTVTHSAFASGFVAPGGAGSPPPIELGSAGATLAAGALLRSAVIPGGAPPGLVARFGPAAPTTTHVADGLGVARYHWTLRDGRAVEAWVVPTVRSDMAIICTGPTTMTARLHDCALMATQAHVSGVPLLAVGPDIGLSHSLQRAAGIASGPRHALATDRSVGPWASGRVTSTASADDHATKTIRKLVVPARYERIASGLAASLAAEARALMALARAGRADDPTQYKGASGAIGKADRQLKAASEQAVRAGLLKTALAGLTAPAWQVVVTPQPGPTGVSQPQGRSGTTTTTTNSSSYYSPPPQPNATVTSHTTHTSTSATTSPAPVHGM